jgi:hypothetical protein
MKATARGACPTRRSAGETWRVGYGKALSADAALVLHEHADALPLMLVGPPRIRYAVTAHTPISVLCVISDDTTSGRVENDPGRRRRILRRRGQMGLGDSNPYDSGRTAIRAAPCSAPSREGRADARETRRVRRRRVGLPVARRSRTSAMPPGRPRPPGMNSGDPRRLQRGGAGATRGPPRMRPGRVARVHARAGDDRRAVANPWPPGPWEDGASR